MTGPPLATHYSRKWLTLAKQYKFLIPKDELRGFYEQDEFYWIGNHYTTPFQTDTQTKSFSTDYQSFYKRVRAVANLIYNQESFYNTILEEQFLLSPGHLPEHAEDGYLDWITMSDIMLANTTVGANPNTNLYPNAAAVITELLQKYFFPNLKLKLKAENNSIQLL